MEVAMSSNTHPAGLSSKATTIIEFMVSCRNNKYLEANHVSVYCINILFLFANACWIPKTFFLKNVFVNMSKRVFHYKLQTICTEYYRISRINEVNIKRLFIVISFRIY